MQHKVCCINLLDSFEGPQAVWKVQSPHTQICSWADSCTVLSRRLCQAAPRQLSANTREKGRTSNSTEPLESIFHQIHSWRTSVSFIALSSLVKVTMHVYSSNPFTWRSLCPADVPGASGSSSCRQIPNLDSLNLNRTFLTINSNGLWVILIFLDLFSWWWATLLITYVHQSNKYTAICKWDMTNHYTTSVRHTSSSSSISSTAL